MSEQAVPKWRDVIQPINAVPNPGRQGRQGSSVLRPLAALADLELAPEIDAQRS